MSSLSSVATDFAADVRSKGLRSYFELAKLDENEFLRRNIRHVLQELGPIILDYVPFVGIRYSLYALVSGDCLSDDAYFIAEQIFHLDHLDIFEWIVGTVGVEIHAYPLYKRSILINFRTCDIPTDVEDEELATEIRHLLDLGSSTIVYFDASIYPHELLSFMSGDSGTLDWSDRAGYHHTLATHPQIRVYLHSGKVVSFQQFRVMIDHKECYAKELGLH